METAEILLYFGRNWPKLERLLLKDGLAKGFYPIILPEIDDHRLIDPQLPVVMAEAERLLRANITNPSTTNFQGLLLEETICQDWKNNTSVVKVCYLNKDAVYEAQYLRETSPEHDLKKYYLISLPHRIEKPQPETLQKLYMEISPLLGS